MSKVKIVHVAYMGKNGAPEYTDDQGRVWYQVPQYITVQDTHDPSIERRAFDHYEWKQLELPDEPKT